MGEVNMLTIWGPLMGLIGVLCVSALVVWFMRRRMHRIHPPKSKIVHVAPVDVKHKLVVVRYLDTDYVTLLGPTAVLLDKIKKDAGEDGKSFSAHLTQEKDA